MKIIHLFQWPLKDIIPIIPKIKEQGFDAIQISPIQGTKDAGLEWWKLYQPTNLSIGNYQIGTKRDLRKLCAKAHSYGLKIFADVVLRHVAGDERDCLKPHRNVDKVLLNFLAEPINGWNIDNDRFQCTRRCTGLPMLDYDEPMLRALYRNFLDELTDVGVDGFRLDQLKHYALPQEGSTILDLFKNYYFYGEAINCPRWLLDEYSKYMKVLTDGRPSDTSRLVAKFETHDDYLEFGWTKRMSDNIRLREWDCLVNNLIYSDYLYYARPFETLWMSPEMKKINTRRY